MCSKSNGEIGYISNETRTRINGNGNSEEGSNSNSNGVNKNKNEKASNTQNHDDIESIISSSSSSPSSSSSSSSITSVSESSSSLSFYEDFPKLYFAVRKGRYANGAVYSSWDTARKHVLDYPDAEYIATPTLIQAQKYVNGFGEEYRRLWEEETETKDRATEQGTATIRKKSISKQQQRLRSPSSLRRTRSLIRSSSLSSSSGGLKNTLALSSSSNNLEKNNCHNENHSNTKLVLRKNLNRKYRESSESTALTAASTAASMITRRSANKPKTNTITCSSSSSSNNKEKRFGHKTRRLLLEYYQLSIDSCNKDKISYNGNGHGNNNKQQQQEEQHEKQNLLSVADFLRKRKMYKRKHKIFIKHWQRSGLLICSHEGKSREDAARQYDSWIEQRYGCVTGNGSASDENENESIQQERTERDKKEQNKGQTRQKTALMREGGSEVNENETKNNDNTRDPPIKIPPSQKTSPHFSTPLSSIPPPHNNKQVAKKRKRPPTSPAQQVVGVVNKNSKKITASAVAAAAANKVAIPETVLATATIVAPGHHHCGGTGIGIARLVQDAMDDVDIEDDGEDHDEQWNCRYQELKAFHAKHGHCKVHKGEDADLHYWVSYTQRRMRPEFARGGARSLTLREEKLLNELDFNPVYKKIVTEFNKYLGMRVAKLFDVVNDSSVDSDSDNGDDNPSPTMIVTTSPQPQQLNSRYVAVEEGGKITKKRIKTKTFFGTVGRISSVSNQVSLVSTHK